ncbi:MAG: response regulator [Candidatus Tantalella remota]|nr:response regulator [Candidatus Tantalella remota]
MRKILIVDDEAAIRKLLSRTLAKKDREILIAETAEETMNIVRKENPRVVLLDLKMPDTNGDKILKRIRRFNRDIRVIIVTGYGDTVQAKDVLREGVFDYITKPFRLSRIRKAVENALKTKPASKKRIKKSSAVGEV